MAEYKINFSKARQARGLPCYAVMRLEAGDEYNELWKTISAHDSKAEAEIALAAATKTGGE